MERKNLNRFHATRRRMCPLSTLLVCFLFVGCSVLSPVSRPGYVPSYVSEKCEAPVFREGDSWKFIGSGGQEWEEKVVAGEGRLQPVQSQKKDFYGFTFSFSELELQKFFPLWVGKSWRGSPMLYTVEGAPLTYFLSLRVVDYATVKVKAGTFECYVIELSISYSLDRGTGFYYYSPVTKSVIKFETQSPFLHKWENYELSSYQVR